MFGLERVGTICDLVGTVSEHEGAGPRPLQTLIADGFDLWITTQSDAGESFICRSEVVAGSRLPGGPNSRVLPVPDGHGEICSPMSLTLSLVPLLPGDPLHFSSSCPPLKRDPWAHEVRST